MVESYSAKHISIALANGHAPALVEEHSPDNSDMSRLDSTLFESKLDASKLVTEPAFRRQQVHMPSAVGPNQLNWAIEGLINSVQPEKWKNIPEPVCQATTRLLSMVDFLKRFVIYQEHRFNNATLSQSQQFQELDTIINQLREEIADKRNELY